MTDFDERIKNAVETRMLPGAVMLARDKYGKLNYEKVVGYRSLEPGAEKPMEVDSVFKLASLSKLLTTIAVLQIVDKGYLSWDSDVSQFVPVLAKQQILAGTGWFGGPIIKNRRNTIKLSHLLTHTAGAGYDFLKIQPLYEYRLRKDGYVALGDCIDVKYAYPLLHEPGEGWTYGSGITWAGKVLEEVTGMNLDEWFKKHICEPLGISSVTFVPLDSAEISARMVSVSWRSGERSVNYPGQNLPDPGKDFLGGEGAYGSMQDYMEIMYSILMDDERLLSKELTAKMFQPQLSGKLLQNLRECLQLPCWISKRILKPNEYNWGVGGVLIDGNSHDVLRKGTLMWSGLLHMLWWIDRESGVCGIFGTHLLPGTDDAIISLMQGFQDDVYRTLRRETGKGEVVQSETESDVDAAKVLGEPPLKSEKLATTDYPSWTVGRLLAWLYSYWQ